MRQIVVLVYVGSNPINHPNTIVRGHLSPKSTENNSNLPFVQRKDRELRTLKYKFESYRVVINISQAKVAKQSPKLYDEVRFLRGVHKASIVMKAGMSAKHMELV